MPAEMIGNPLFPDPGDGDSSINEIYGPDTDDKKDDNYDSDNDDKQ